VLNSIQQLDGIVLKNNTSRRRQRWYMVVVSPIRSSYTLKHEVSGATLVVRSVGVIGLKRIYEFALHGPKLVPIMGPGRRI
jgi:hypothetical protein